MIRKDNSVRTAMITSQHTLGKTTQAPPGGIGSMRNDLIHNQHHTSRAKEVKPAQQYMSSSSQQLEAPCSTQERSQAPETLFKLQPLLVPASVPR